MKKRKKIAIISISGICIIIGALIFTIGKKMEQMQKAMDGFENVAICMDKVKDGTYTGDSDAGLVKVQVEVTVEDHKIKTIEIKKHQNGKGKPAEAMVDEMIRKNTDQVDLISGATYSSKTIQNAVNKALQEGMEE